MKKRFYLIIILSALLAIAANSDAATIKHVGVASEYRYYQAPFTDNENYFILSWAIVDNDTYNIYLQNVPDSSGDMLLDPVPLWDDFTPYQFSKSFYSPSPGHAWEGIDYNFYIEGDLDNKTWNIPQGSIQQIGYPSTVTISGGIHPTITWNKVADAEWYRVRLFPIVNGNPHRADLLDQSGNITDDGSLSYSYHYTGDAFVSYGTLAVAVETYDNAGLTSGWVNRSVHYSQYNPAISNVCIASEYRHYQAPFTDTDEYFMLSWAIVDNNTYDVYLQNVPDSSGDILLNPVPLWDDFTPYQFVKYLYSPSPGPAWEGIDYNFYIEGDLDNKTWNIPQGSIQQIGYPSTVTISGGMHPTITWNKVANADWYRVRLFPVVNGNPNRSDLLDQSGNITDDGSLSYSYQYTGDAFDTYGTLAVAVETCDNAGLTSLWANRSVHYSQHNPVPETAGMPAIPLLLLDD